MAHITGGGLPGNLVRILPKGCRAEIDSSSWQPLPIFSYIQSMGNVDTDEMYRVFNMGIGMTLVVGKNDSDRVLRTCKRNKQPAYLIGEIRKGRASVRIR